MNAQNKNSLYNTARLYLLYGIMATIVFSLLNLNSICIILFTLVWLIEGGFREKWELLKKDPLFYGYAAYFLLQVIGLLYTPGFASGWKQVESKVGFLILPLIFCSTPFLDKHNRSKVMMALSISLVVASLYCLAVTTWKYTQTHSTDLFFYHALVSPLSHHAIYFSVYIFISLIFLVIEGREQSWLKKRKWLLGCWVLFDLILLYLLASKMVLGVLLVFIIFFILYRYRKNYRRWQAIAFAAIMVAVLAIVIVSDNPIKRRFADLLFNKELLQKDRYDDGTYFNGLEFRLLLWKLTYEILHDNHAFVLGVGPANSQHYMDQKFLDKHMYAGNKSMGTTGYLGYNCHNQFLQCTLQSGIIGSVVFIFWCCMILKRTYRKKIAVLTAMILIIFTFFFTEAVFERQYGMILCTLLPLLYLYGKPGSPDVEGVK